MSSHISVIEVCGTGAFECLDRLLACDLFLYDGQARQTVILDELGSVIADVTVAKVDGLFRLFVDGLTAAELRALIEVEVRDLLDEHALVSLHGPFAWELAAMWLGRAVVSLPPLALFRTPSGVVMRAGKTGEFGYETLVPLPLLESARDRLLSIGQRAEKNTGLLEVPLEVVDRCVLESGGYVARIPGLAGLTPPELQLQWRTSPRKPYRGRVAAEQRSGPASKRVAWFGCDSVLAPGAPIALEGEPCGHVLFSAPAPARKGAFGVALIERRFSHPGLRFEADASVVLHSAAPPLVEPWSNRVRPEIDSYATLDPARFASHGVP